MSDRVHMPALGGATEWLNSAPLSDPDLRGTPVLVDFWTLTCINWLRAQPYVRAWSQAYRGDGLLVVGVHTPEFSFEHDVEHVERAVTDRDIDYPVVLDNDYAVWTAFDNHFWPALYFVDAGGLIRDEHFGEGRYNESEIVIQQLLGIDRELAAVEGRGIEAPADWDHLKTPETYLGYSRSGRFASQQYAAFDKPAAYAFPDVLTLNHWALQGNWTIGPEQAHLNRPDGSIACRFHARDAHLVLSRSTPEQIPFRVTVDDRAPGRSHGEDVDADGLGLLDSSRLYQLWREDDLVRERRLEITFGEPGAQAYAFTFG